MLTAETLLRALKNDNDYFYYGSVRAEIWEVRKTDPEESLPNVLYVASSDNRVPVVPNTCMLSVRKNAADQVLRFLQNLIAHDYRRSAGLARLSALAAEEAGLTDLAQQAAVVMENPVWFLYSDYHVLESSQEGQKGAPNQTELKNKSLGFSSGSLLLETGASCGYQRILAPVRHKGRLTGYVYAAAVTRPFMPEVDSNYMEQISVILAAAISAGRSADKMPVDQHLLTDLIDGRAGDSLVIEQRMRHVGWNISDMYYLFSVDVQDRKPIPAIQETLTLYLGRKVHAYKHYLVALIGTDLSDVFNEVAYPDLFRYLKERDLYAGLSNGFLDLTKTRIAFEQSVISVPLRKRLNTAVHFSRYEDIASVHLFHIADEQGVDVLSFCYPAILMVERYDKENSTDYLKTLASHIFLNLGLQQTADLLFIHRNTLYNRLNFLKEHFHIDFQNHRVLTKMRQSLEMYSYLGRINVQKLMGPFY